MNVVDSGVVRAYLIGALDSSGIGGEYSVKDFTPEAYKEAERDIREFYVEVLDFHKDHPEIESALWKFLSDDPGGDIPELFWHLRNGKSLQGTLENWIASKNWDYFQSDKSAEAIQAANTVRGLASAFGPLDVDITDKGNLIFVPAGVSVGQRGVW